MWNDTPAQVDSCVIVGSEEKIRDDFQKKRSFQTTQLNQNITKYYGSNLRFK